MKSLLIVGGGMTGLAAGYLASKAGVKVTIIEASDSVGGLLSTFETGGDRLEHFYHHAFTRDAELRWLFKELGIDSQFEFRDSTMGVYRGGETYAFNGPADLLRFRPMGFLDKARFALTSLYLARAARWQESENIPALQWFYKNAGRRATESLWEPLLRVKFGPYAEKTPLAWMVGRMRQRLNSRSKGGQEKLGYLRGSLHVLLKALMKALQDNGAIVRTGLPATGLVVRDGRLKGIQTSAGILEADAFLFTIPTPVLANLAEPVAPGYAAELRQIEYFGAVCTVLEMKRSLSPHYWLNIADPGLPFGGIIEHTRLIPAERYDGRTIIYLSRYFAASDSLARQSTSAIETLMLDGLRKVFPSFSEQDILNIRIFSSRTAAVVCDLDFSKRVPHCRAPINGLYLASMPHIYPDERSCNNSVRVAAEACRVMGLASPEVPRCASLSGQIHMDI